MTFCNHWLAVQLAHQAVIGQLALLRAQTHCPAEIALLTTRLDITVFITPLGDERHDRVLTVWHKFRGVGVLHARNIACIFNHRNLHTEADAEVRNVVFTGVARGGDFAFHAAITEAARDKDRIQTFQQFFAAGFYVLRIDKLDVDGHAVLQATVFQRLDNRFIGVRQFNVFADHTDSDFARRIRFFINNLFPFRQVSFRTVQAESFTNIIVQPLRFQQARNFINGIDVFQRNDRFFRNVTEQSDFGAFVSRNRAIGTANQHIRLNTDRQQFFNGVLGRFGFHLTCRRHVWHQRQVHEHRVFATHFNRHLTNGFKERQGFDIAYGAADFDQHDVMAFAARQNAFFDSVGDVRNNLNGRAQIVATALFAQNFRVDTACREVVAARHAGADKTLVVPQVQIGFSAVFSNEHFPVLDWTHGARIDVDIRIQFHDGHVKATGFKNGCEGGCGNAFTQRGNDPAGHKNIVRCHAEPEKLGLKTME
ncbi:hypothetical protein BN128_2285 [Cronobacter sakazakii 696]|nr:hypothetical protein BN128_2285 [Cronobacter sakazakii 696]